MTIEVTIRLKLQASFEIAGKKVENCQLHGACNTRPFCPLQCCQAADVTSLAFVAGAATPAIIGNAA